MKRNTNNFLLLLFAACTIVAAACNQQNSTDISAQFKGHAFPKSVGWVNDFTYLYSQAEADTLNKIIVAHKNTTGNQISIVTINDSIITPANLGDYATTLFNIWDVGEKGRNNGVLICIVPNAHLLQITCSQGLEKKLTNDEIKRIMDSVIAPEFVHSDYYMGTKKGVLAIIDKIK